MEKEKSINALLPTLTKDQVLDPSYLRFGSDYVYLDNLAAKLVELNKHGEYINSLAKKLTFTTRTTLVVELQDAYFSNGEKIKPIDVLRSFKRVILLGAPHSNPKDYIVGARDLKSIDQEVEGIKEGSKNTVIIKLSKPVNDILYYLNLTDFSILHSSKVYKKKLYAKDWITNNSGPYSLKVSKEKTILEKNNRYFNQSIKFPSKVIIEKIEEKDIEEKVNNGQVQIGDLSFSTYSKSSSKFISNKHLMLFGEKGHIFYIIANTNKGPGKSKSFRNWLYYQIYTNYKIEKNQQAYLNKASQFFIPGARGFLNEDKIKSTLKNLNSPSPTAIESLNIRSISGLKDFMPSDFVQQLSKAIGLKVSLNLDINNADYLKFLKDRDFDFSIMTTSMSYKVLSESLNFAYQSSPPKFKDPTGKINLMLNQLKRANSLEEEILIENIITQMINDSECIPVAYLTTPSFINTKILDHSEMNLSESFQFWRLRVK